MRAFGCLLVLVLAVGIGLYIYKTQLTELTPGGAPPEQQIDVVGVKMDLQAIARAERTYVISHGRYGTIDELFADRAIPFSGEDRHGYRYSAQPDGESHFRVTATPVDPAKTTWPKFSIDETMQVVQE